MCYPIAGQSGENVAAGAIHNSVPVPVHSEGDLSSSGPPRWSGFGVPCSCRVGLLHPSFSYGGSHAIITQADMGKEYYVSSNTKFVGPELFVGSMTVSSLIVLW